MSTDPAFASPELPVVDNDLIMSKKTVNKDGTLKFNPRLPVNFGLDDEVNVSNRRPLTTDDSDNDFQRVTHNRSHHKSSKSSKNTHVSQCALNPIDITHSNDEISANVGRVDNAANGVNSQNVSHQTQDVQNGKPNQAPSSIPIVSDASTRFAQSRYPFPPFVLRFNSGNVSVNQVKEGLLVHCKNVFGIDLKVLNCRLIKHGDGKNSYDLLVYAKDVLSFSFLLDDSHWPVLFGNERFSFPFTPAIPPQLCLLVKDVDLNIDFQDFCMDIKDKYPQVKNIIRLKNKFQNDIRLVKLELTSPVVRNDLLNAKRILSQHISYDIAESLAPVSVLICSKCLGIGHFKKQCTQIMETCKTCGDTVVDLKDHICSNVEKCIHCNQNHKSSSLKCPVIKSCRAELTRKILYTNNQHTAGSDKRNETFTTFPFAGPPTASKSMSFVVNNNPVIDKLNELIFKLSDVQNKLVTLEVKYDKFDQFMISKNQSDEKVKEDLLNLSSNCESLKKDVVHNSLFVDRHENIFTKLVLPLFEDICSFITLHNTSKGRPVDADLKCRLGRYHLQLKKATEGKRFCN